MENTIIIGDGLVARAFKFTNIKNAIIFASGVSNSKSNCDAACFRELNLLKKVLEDNCDEKLVIYFSTYSIFDSSFSESKYVNHKLAIENFLAENSANYLIVRTSNLVGNYFINSSTIFNYIYSSIRNEAEFDLWIGAFRNFIDIDHFVLLVEAAIDYDRRSNIITIVNPIDYSVLDFANAMAEYLEVTPKFRLIDKGQQFIVDKGLSIDLFQKLNIPTDKYLFDLIVKYC